MLDSIPQVVNIAGQEAPNGVGPGGTCAAEEDRAEEREAGRRRMGPGTRTDVMGPGSISVPRRSQAGPQGSVCGRHWSQFRAACGPSARVPEGFDLVPALKSQVRALLFSWADLGKALPHPLSVPQLGPKDPTPETSGDACAEGGVPPPGSPQADRATHQGQFGQCSRRRGRPGASEVQPWTPCPVQQAPGLSSGCSSFFAWAVPALW